jgi:hypothetical protein
LPYLDNKFQHSRNLKFFLCPLWPNWNLTISSCGWSPTHLTHKIEKKKTLIGIPSLGFFSPPSFYHIIYIFPKKKYD